MIQLVNVTLVNWHINTCTLTGITKYPWKIINPKTLTKSSDTLLPILISVINHLHAENPSTSFAQITLIFLLLISHLNPLTEEFCRNPVKYIITPFVWFRNKKLTLQSHFLSCVASYISNSVTLLFSYTSIHHKIHPHLNSFLLPVKLQKENPAGCAGEGKQSKGN